MAEIEPAVSLETSNRLNNIRVVRTTAMFHQSSGGLHLAYTFVDLGVIGQR